MITSSLRVLVTAVSGDLGQALVKALRLNALSCHGCDMDGTGVGSAFVESFHVVTSADDPSYIDVVDRLCCALAIDALVPGSEPEIRVLSRLGVPPRLPLSGTPIVCQDGKWLETYGDKLACLNALVGNVELAPFADGSDRQAVARLMGEVDFPVVVKSRLSSGSRGKQIVRNDRELDVALAAMPLPLVQGFIDASGGEFSVGAFVCEEFSSVIAFKRDLGPVGCSWFAETSTDESVIDYAMRIARASGLKGSANIQVRKSLKGVRLLEVNARFSSLVAARAVCGFRDAQWSVELALGRHPEAPGRFKQIRFRRFFHELVDLGAGFAAVSEWAPREASIGVDGA